MQVLPTVPSPTMTSFTGTASVMIDMLNLLIGLLTDLIRGRGFFGRFLDTVRRIE